MPNDPSSEPTTSPNPGDPPPATNPEPTSAPPAAAPNGNEPPANPEPSGPDGSPDDPPPPAWREDWREAMAGKDEKAQRYLSRYSSPENVFKALQSLRQKMDEGALKQAMPDPSDEVAMKAWREAAGVPEKAGEYLEAEDVQKLELTDVEKDIAAPYLEAAIERGMPAGEIAPWLGLLKEQIRGQAERLAEEDANFKREAEDTLRVQYGPEYRMNMTHMANVLIPEMGEELWTEMCNSRLPDGRKFADSPKVLDWFVNLARKMQEPGVNPMPTSEAARAQMQTEKASIEKTIQNDPDKYWGDKQMQARYTEILKLEERLASQ